MYQSIQKGSGIKFHRVPQDHDRCLNGLQQLKGKIGFQTTMGINDINIRHQILIFRKSDIANRSIRVHNGKTHLIVGSFYDSKMKYQYLTTTYGPPCTMHRPEQTIILLSFTLNIGDKSHGAKVYPKFGLVMVHLHNSNAIGQRLFWTIRENGHTRTSPASTIKLQPESTVWVPWEPEVTNAESSTNEEKERLVS